MKKGRFSTIILLLIFVVGLSLLIYPSASNYWNSLHQTKAIKSYVDSISEMDTEDFDAIWQKVDAYNKKIKTRNNIYIPNPDEAAEYSKLLNTDGTGVMGYIDIPCIEVTLPVYHTTDDNVLQVAAGHLEWTSLPGGGTGTHCVLSGHRGLPSAKLFTNLDKMSVGDTFVLNILDRTLTYEVDQILIVEPTETQELMIRDREDLCTLVTCTPYGINTHRLLVRGHRVENAERVKELRVTNDATRIEPLLIAPIIAAPILLALIVIVIVNDRRRRKRTELEKKKMISSDDDDTFI